MTIKQGRLGRKYNRAAMADPRGSWAPGAPASAGFVPEQGVRFSGTADPLTRTHAPGCPLANEDGYTFAGTSRRLSKFSAKKPRGSRSGRRRGRGRKRGTRRAVPQVSKFSGFGISSSGGTSKNSEWCRSNQTRICDESGCWCSTDPDIDM